MGERSMAHVRAGDDVKRLLRRLLDWIAEQFEREDTPPEGRC